MEKSLIPTDDMKDTCNPTRLEPNKLAKHIRCKVSSLESITYHSKKVDVRGFNILLSYKLLYGFINLFQTY